MSSISFLHEYPCQYLRRQKEEKFRRKETATLLSSLYPRKIFYPRCGRIRPFASVCFGENGEIIIRTWLGRGEGPTRMKKGRAAQTFWPTISKLNLIFLGALRGELAGSDSSSHPRTASHHDVLVKYSNGCRVPLIYPALGSSQTTSLISMFRSKASRSRIGNTLGPCWITSIEPFVLHRPLIVILLGVRFDVRRRESVCNFDKDTIEIYIYILGRLAFFFVGDFLKHFF